MHFQKDYETSSLILNTIDLGLKVIELNPRSTVKKKILIIQTTFFLYNDFATQISFSLIQIL